MIAVEGTDVPVIAVAPDAGAIPVPAGGPIVDGTYVLTDVTLYSSTTAPGPTGDVENETIQISGAGADAGTFLLYDVFESATSVDRTTWDTAVEIDDGGTPTVLTGSLACPTGTDAWTNPYSMLANASTELLVWDYQGNGDILIHTYTKQP
jgi:hypothetical protein